MKAPFPLAFALAVGAAGAVDALDSRRAPSQYVITKWGAESLPSSAIHALLQTRDGYLWLGTTTGLVRFDGARFVVYGPHSSPSFADGGVSRLAQAQDGSLFVGMTSGTVLRLKDGVFNRPFVPSGTAYVTSLLPARDGSVWVGVHGQNVHRLVDGRTTAFTRPPGLQAPFAMAEDGEGGVWIGTRERGLVRYDGREFARHPVTTDTVQALLFDRARALWIGTPHGLLRWQKGRVTRYTRRDGLCHDNVSAILEDRDGNLWIGTAGGGLSRLSEGRWTRVTVAEGLSDDDVRSLREDHEGNLWVGTADGLNRLSDGRFVTYGRLEGLADQAVSSVAPALDGSVWVGTATGTVARLRNGQVEPVRLPGGVGREGVLALHQARDGSLWIALDNARLLRWKDGAVTEHTPADSQKVRAFSEDEEGPIFLVTGQGPSRIGGGRALPLYADIPRGRYAHGAYRDRQGTLWVYDLAGLARLRDGRWRLLTTQDGLPHNRVRWVSGDEDGGLWAATIGGLAYVKDDAIRSVTVREGLPEDYLRLVLDDGRGHLWIAAMGHVFRLDKREVLEVMAGQRPQVSPIVFDTADGLRTTETLLSNNPGFRAPDGRLWFATAKGVSVVDPARLSTDDPAPSVSLEAFNVDGQKAPAQAGEALFPAGRGEVTIEYTALHLGASRKVRFRHRLEGLDGAWAEAGDRARVYYSNLPPGHYRFSVMASNRDGIWNGPAATLAFAIRPPFTRTPLFLALCAAAVMGLGLLAHRLRLGQIRSRFAAIIGERTRIARELHDTLAQGLAGVGLQIDTALSTLAEEPDLAREQMRLARAMARSSLAEVRRSIWVLRAQAAKGADGLGVALSNSLRHLGADHGLAMTVAVTGEPRALPAELERNLLRIAHEAVTNAARHAGATHIEVALHVDDEAVHLSVRDDGRGFDPEGALLASGGEHFGLLGIQERARALGGELEVRSQPGAGAEVVCRLPQHGRSSSEELEASGGLP
jgi:signal transduction histidine kinase/ligand-binding sensor domain-containing protein